LAIAALCRAPWFARARAGAVAFVVCAGTALAMPAGAAPPEARIALVIGNGEYASGRLANPANDARLMAESLRGLGFEVLSRRDADKRTMQRAMQEFGVRLEKAGPGAVGLFYYAGHGLQVSGRNYLVPIAAQIEREGDVDIEAVPADWVIDQMRQARNRLNIVILDACRNNPFSRGLRSVNRGLAVMDAPAGILIAYSTAPGDVAADGGGSNSPYTDALSRAMRDVHEPVEQVFKRARIAVMNTTGGKQIPWEASSLTGDFFFTAPAPPVAAAAPAIQPAAAAAPVVPGHAAAERTNAAAPAAIPAIVGTPAPRPAGAVDPRCKSILEHAQLGESINEEERSYVKEHCR
jgi:uncharacterized caspase-like protein